MYRTVADASLIEAAQRIARLVRACRNEGERERRLPAQVLAAMHEARLLTPSLPARCGRAAAGTLARLLPGGGRRTERQLGCRGLARPRRDAIGEEPRK